MFTLLCLHCRRAVLLLIPQLSQWGHWDWGALYGAQLYGGLDTALSGAAASWLSHTVSFPRWVFLTFLVSFVLASLNPSSSSCWTDGEMVGTFSLGILAYCVWVIVCSTYLFGEKAKVSCLVLLPAKRHLTEVRGFRTSSLCGCLCQGFHIWLMVTSWNLKEKVMVVGTAHPAFWT